MYERNSVPRAGPMTPICAREAARYLTPGQAATQHPLGRWRLRAHFLASRIQRLEAARTHIQRWGGLLFEIPRKCSTCDELPPHGVET